jgi:hypothetical protein
MRIVSRFGGFMVDSFRDFLYVFLPNNFFCVLFPNVMTMRPLSRQLCAEKSRENATKSFIINRLRSMRMIKNVQEVKTEQKISLIYGS